MKRIIPFMLIVAALSVGAQENPSLDAIVPGNAILYVKTVEVRKLVDAAKIFLATLLPDKQRQKAVQFISVLKQKSGIDILDAASLRKAGIDVDRPAGLAFFGGEGKDERIAVFIPSLGKKDLSMGMVEIMKKMSAEKDPDIYPAVTEYKGSRISQVKSDVFMTGVGGYFVITSRGEIAREIIDTAAAVKGSIAGDKHFSEYVKSGIGVYDINAFATIAMVQELQKKGGRKKHGGEDPAVVEHDSGNTDEPVTWIDYAFVGLSISKDRIRAGLSFKNNGADPKVEAVLKSLKPRTVQGAPNYKNALVYSLFSIWPEKMDSAFGTKSAIGAVYQSSKKKMELDWGISFGKDFLPHMDGMVSIIGDKGGGLQGSLASFYSMHGKESGSLLLNKIVGKFKDGGKDGRFGMEKTNSGTLYWIMNDKMEKTYFAADDRGFYSANEQRILETTLAAGSVGAGGGLPGIAGTTGDDLFASIFVSRKSPIRVLAMLFAATKSSPGIYHVLTRLGDAAVTGRKRGPLVILDLGADIQEEGK